MKRKLPVIPKHYISLSKLKSVYHMLNKSDIKLERQTIAANKRANCCIIK